MGLRLRELREGLALVVLATIEGIGAVEDGGDDQKEFVITLDHSNFTHAVSKQHFLLVEFYAPWCGHCKQIAPEFEKAAAALSKLDPPTTLAKVDAADEANKDLATQYDVKGFPTLKILRNAEKVVQDYKGPREADGIVEHVKKQFGHASLEIKSADEAAKIIDEKRIFIVGVFPKFSGEEFENFTKLAEKLRSDYDFGHTLDAKVLPRGESSVSGPLTRLLKPFDEFFADFKDFDFDFDAVGKFIKEEDDPSVVEFIRDRNNAAYLRKFFTSEDPKFSWSSMHLGVIIARTWFQPWLMLLSHMKRILMC